MSAKAYFEKKVMGMLGRPLTKTEFEVFTATYEAILQTGPKVVEKELLADPSLVKAYHYQPTFHHAVRVVIDTVFACLAGKTTKPPDPVWISAIAALTDPQPAGPMKSGKSGLPAAGQAVNAVAYSANITLDEVKKLAEALKAAPGPNVNAHPPVVYGPVTMGNAISKKPYQQQLYAHPHAPDATWLDEGADPMAPAYTISTKPPPKLKERAKETLLERAKAQAARLKAAKLKEEIGEKYEALTGKTISPEEAEAMIIKALDTTKEGTDG